MSQPILLLNCGSSSIKYQLLDPEHVSPLAVGIVQRIGLGESTITHE
ncbi:MAG: acetate kinase, partial [Actinobacteria bacterium]|nr:acetate kinase [Actinomycetota bacterium]